MAFIDNSLLLSNAQAITTTAASTNVYDIATSALAAGTTATGITFGTGNYVGADLGTGDGVATPAVVFTITTTGTGAGTVTFSVQAAPTSTQAGSAAGTYVTLASSAAYVGTTLLAGNVIVLPIPPFAQVAPAETPLPRFYRAYYTVASSATVSVTAAIQLNPSLGIPGTMIGNNFTAA